MSYDSNINLTRRMSETGLLSRARTQASMKEAELKKRHSNKLWDKLMFEQGKNIVTLPGSSAAEI
jgi:hypothetical protein